METFKTLANMFMLTVVVSFFALIAVNILLWLIMEIMQSVIIMLR